MIYIHSVVQILLTFISLLFVMDCHATPTALQSLTISYSGDWAPYIYKSDDGKIEGDDVLLLERILNEMGVTLNYKALPERRLEANVASGKADVAIGAAKTEFRLKSYFFSAPYRQENIGFAIHKSALELSPQPSLIQFMEAGYLLAINTGGRFGDLIDNTIRHRFADQIIHIEHSQRRLAFVLRRQNALVVDDVNVLNAIIRSNDYTDLLIADQILASRPVHFMFSRQTVDEAFIHHFNELLKNRLTKMPYAHERR